MTYIQTHWFPIVQFFSNPTTLRSSNIRNGECPSFQAFAATIFVHIDSWYVRRTCSLLIIAKLLLEPSVPTKFVDFSKRVELQEFLNLILLIAECCAQKRQSITHFNEGKASPWMFQCIRTHQLCETLLHVNFKRYEMLVSMRDKCLSFGRDTSPKCPVRGWAKSFASGTNPWQIRCSNRVCAAPLG